MKMAVVSSRALPFLLAAACGLLASAGHSAVVAEDYRPRQVFVFKPSGLYDPEEPYQVGGVDWFTQVNPGPYDLPLGGTSQFLETLTRAFPAASGWTFRAANQSLSDSSLKIHTYDALGTPNLGGVEFDLEYVPMLGSLDPTQNVHWIQTVFDNHARGGSHGTLESVVDKFIPDGAPYYDTGGGAADGRNFYDFPKRSDADQAHWWYANLYLVVGPAAGSPGPVTVYDGITWGWANVPEPGIVWLLLVAVAVAWAFHRLLAGPGVSRRRRSPEVS
jgi:hypothetical protein